MRRLLVMVASIVLAGAGMAAADDAHGEMAQALAAQVDAHPTPAALPVANATSHVLQTAAAKHIPARAAVIAGHAAADQAQQAQGQSVALAHQAQAAAQAAAGQAQAQAARQRAANHPHPGH